MLSHRLVSLTLLTSVTVACTSPGQPGSAGDSHTGHGGSAFVTGTDVRRAGGRTALDGVRLLIRPPSMTGRAPATFMKPLGDPPVVYLDGVRLTDVRTLEQIHHSALESMRFLDASSASVRYGTNHFGGALVVTTHTGPAAPDSSSTSGHR